MNWLDLSKIDRVLAGLGLERWLFDGMKDVLPRWLADYLPEDRHSCLRLPHSSEQCLSPQGGPRFLDSYR